MNFNAWRILLVPILLASPVTAAPPVIQDPGTILSNLIEVVTGLPVGIQIIATEDPTSWSATGLPPGFNIDSQTGLIQGTPAAASSTTFTVFATNADGTGSRPVTLNVFPRDTDLEQGVDLSTFGNPTKLAAFIQNPEHVPNRFWFRLEGSGPVGNDVVRTRLNLPDSTNTGMRAYVQGPCQFTFAWRVSSEQGFDFLAFYVNTALVDSISGATVFNYVDVTVDLPAGLHELDWIYIKDGSVSAGLDGGFVDNVRITGYPVWAAQKGLNPFNSDFAIDKEKDGNTLMTEYALNLNPGQKEFLLPTMSFEPDGRAVVEVSKNSSAIGVTVDLEQNPTLMNWSSAGLETLTNTNSLLRKREIASPGWNSFRINVTSP